VLVLIKGRREVAARPPCNCMRKSLACPVFLSLSHSFQEKTAKDSTVAAAMVDQREGHGVGGINGVVFVLVQK
jgi:hypothetical protein